MSESSTTNQKRKSDETFYERFVRANIFQDIESKIVTARPYIFTSFIAWPMYWVYRGLEWGHHKGSINLPVYIHRTYLQAKFMQFGIIMAGIVAATMLNTDVKNRIASKNIK